MSSQHILPPLSPPIKIHKPEKIHSNNQSKNTLTVSSLMVDPNIQRRHSMDTSQLNPISPTNNTVVKSQSTIMPLPINNSNDLSEQLLSPPMSRKKSVSSKERLFSVQSLHRTKSNEHLIKVMTQPIDEHNRKHSIKHDEQKSPSLSITIPEDSTMLSQPFQNRRIYEHRNSLLPNDPGLNGIGSNQSIDRRGSNESDESDNLSQYFRSPSSRKSSLMTTNDILNPVNIDLSHERSQSVTATITNDTTRDATRRLQNFIKSSDEKRLSRGSTGDDSINYNKTEERKSTSTLGSFKFLKKKTKSVDFTNQVC